MTRWGMSIDLARCTGCNACSVACRQENNVPVTTEAEGDMGRNLDWIQLVTEAKGDYDNFEVEQYPLMCQQCDHAPCVRVCPTSATYRDGEGIVAQIYPRCIGCRYCTNACPYSAKTFNWHRPSWPDGTERRLNPEVSLRPVGVVEKCTFCHHRLQNARDAARYEGREFKPEDYVPACVEVCPARAMTFGDLDMPESEIHKRANSRASHQLLEDLGTEPKVFYIAQHRAPNEGDQ